ncbi:MAG: TetR/AcrR family transcriptional regulator [Jatrophihabitantaceae bacterium]
MTTRPRTALGDGDERAQRITSPRMQRRKERSQQAMLDAAETLFAEDQFTAIRIEDIASMADVSVGTVYTYFGNKDGLYFAVSQRQLERALSYLADAVNPDQSPWEQVAATGAAYRDLLLENPAIVRFLTSDSPQGLSPDVVDRVRQGIETLYDAFADRIQAAIDAGQIIPVDARLTARFLVGSWIGVASLAVRNIGPTFTLEQARACLDQAVLILGAGLTTNLQSQPHSAVSPQ